MDGGDEYRVIARIGDREIRYGKVACDPSAAALNPRWLAGRTVERACAEAEQEQFAALVGAELRERACAIEGCSPSDEEIARFRPPVLADEALLRKAALESRRVPEAVARVLRGESIESVHEQVIAPLGVSLEKFRFEVTRYKSPEALERYLAKDGVAMIRASFEKHARQRAVRALLRSRIADRAAHGQSIEEAADAYLATLAATVGIEIVDKRFTLPAGREIFSLP